MKTYIEVYDNQVKAAARHIELQNAKAKNLRIITVTKLLAYDYRGSTPDNSREWSCESGDGNLIVIEYDR